MKVLYKKWIINEYNQKYAKYVSVECDKVFQHNGNISLRKDSKFLNEFFATFPVKDLCHVMKD